jgi:hypothetical protein
MPQPAPEPAPTAAAVATAPTGSFAVPGPAAPPAAESLPGPHRILRLPPDLPLMPDESSGRPDPARYPRVIAVTALAGLVLGGLWGLLNPPDLVGRADLVVDGAFAPGSDELVSAPTRREVATQAALLGNRAVRTGAARRLGWQDFSASVSSDPESNLISVTVAADTRDRAAAAVRAYTGSYLALLGARQRLDLRTQLAGADRAIAFASRQDDRLDRELAAADRADSADEADRGALLARQAPRRQSIAAAMLESQERRARIQTAARALPMTVHTLTSDVPIEPGGPSRRQWAGLGALLGAAVGAVLCLRSHPPPQGPARRR